MIELLRSEVFLNKKWYDHDYTQMLYYHRGSGLPTDGSGQTEFFGFVKSLNEKLEDKHKTDKDTAAHQEIHTKGYRTTPFSILRPGATSTARLSLR